MPRIFMAPRFPRINLYSLFVISVLQGPNILSRLELILVEGRSVLPACLEQPFFSFNAEISDLPKYVQVVAGFDVGYRCLIWWDIANAFARKALGYGQRLSMVDELIGALECEEEWAVARLITLCLLLLVSQLSYKAEQIVNNARGMGQVAGLLDQRPGTEACSMGLVFVSLLTPRGIPLLSGCSTCCSLTDI
jgi:hypothetical protein